MKRRAFTLVELLVSVSIMSLMAGLLFPAVQAAREAARSAACQSNLHQIGIDVFDGEIRQGIIPNYTDYGLRCPTVDDAYLQEFSGDRREVLINTFPHGYTSQSIAIVWETDYSHFGVRYGVFLDGHVAPASTANTGSY